jgi:colicin import membrane protein
MDAAADRPEFEPPQQGGMLRGFSLAVLAHLLLIAALTWGLRWNTETTELAAEAELWSSLPQQAAPKEVVAPPPPPAPPPKPVVREQPPPEPVKRDADIALEREKKRKEAEAQERRQAQERERERQKKLEAQRKQEELKKAEEEKKQEQAKLAAAEKRKKEEEDRKRREKEKQDELRVAKLREENLKRMQGLAGGTGAPGSTGTAARSSGPSASWAGRVRARVKPNIVFGDDVAGNPAADVEVRLSPDGTIVGKRLVKSSGVKAWDEAVLRALDKTETLPRDTDGRVPSSFIIEFKPKG